MRYFGVLLHTIPDSDKFSFFLAFKFLFLDVFFRFRIGNEAGGGAAVGDVLNMSGGDLQLPSDQQQGQAMHQAKNRPKLKDMEGLRASQSFDESVILDIH